MVSQCGDVTGPLPCGLFPFVSIAAAAGAAGRELLLSVLGAEALARDLDEVSAVGQPIEGGGGQEGLPEELRPFRPITIGGQKNRTAFIPLVDDVVEILGPGRAQALEPEFIEHEQSGARVAGQALFVRAVGAAAARWASILSVLMKRTS